MAAALVRSAALEEPPAQWHFGAWPPNDIKLSESICPLFDFLGH
jgi:hypothetical protein